MNDEIPTMESNTMQETIEQAQQAIVEDFSRFGEWEERYAHLIDLGRQLPELPEEYMVDKFRVRGCQSTVYLHPKLQDGRVIFEATSDAMIVRGLIALLLRVYSNRTPDEILSAPPHFIQELGLTKNLTIGRQNGLKAMVEQLKLYAMAFKSMQQAKFTTN